MGVKRGVRLDAPFELVSDGQGDGIGDSARELQPLERRSRLIFFSESVLSRRFLLLSTFFFGSMKEKRIIN